jgi:hypothetical protein
VTLLTQYSSASSGLIVFLITVILHLGIQPPFLGYSFRLHISGTIRRVDNTAPVLRGTPSCSRGLRDTQRGNRRTDRIISCS